jgi:hypothetical protein
MLGHFLNLFAQSRDAFLAALGTTGLGWWVQGIIWFVVTELATSLVIWRLRGKESMRTRLKENFKIGLYVWIIVMACVYVPVFGWNVIKSVYADHQEMVKTIAGLKAKQLSLVDPKTRDDEIARLKGESEGLQTKIHGLENHPQRAISKLVPDAGVAPKITYYDIGENARPNPKIAAKHHRTFFVTTNQTISPVRILLTCNTGLVDKEEGLINYHGLWTDGGGWAGSKNQSGSQWGIAFSSPGWNPTVPMYVTIYYDADIIPSCSFEQK